MTISWRRMPGGQIGGFWYDLPAIQAAITESTKIVYIASEQSHRYHCVRQEIEDFMAMRDVLVVFTKLITNTWQTLSTRAGWSI